MKKGIRETVRSTYLKEEKKMKKILIYLLIFIMSGLYVESQAQELLRVTGPKNAAKLTFLPLDKGSLLVSVLDTEESPVLGLGFGDFTITKGHKTFHVIFQIIIFYINYKFSNWTF
jgi:hypothetical protein